MPPDFNILAWNTLDVKKAGISDLSGVSGLSRNSLNYFLVPRVGIEPTLLSEPDFESGASTNFTTEAEQETESPAGRIIADLGGQGNRTAIPRCSWPRPRRPYCMC